MTRTCRSPGDHCGVEMGLVASVSTAHRDRHRRCPCSLRSSGHATVVGDTDIDTHRMPCATSTYDTAALRAKLSMPVSTRRHASRDGRNRLGVLVGVGDSGQLTPE
jgi:hypothetical protein